MCLALYIPSHGTVDIVRLKEAYLANPDGCGMMWASDNILQTGKGICSFDLFFAQFEMNRMLWPESSFVIHLRSASSSVIGNEYCHPFYVNENLAFVHNGNFVEFQGDNKYSDTQRFNEEVLKKLPNEFLHIPEIRRSLEQYCIESMSKMIFMDNIGQVIFINEQAGYWEGGIWYSNGGIENYIGYGFSGAYLYSVGDIRHKGGLITVQMFSEKRRKKWQRCEACQGWFLKEKTISGYCIGCNTLKRLRGFYVKNTMRL